MSSVDTSEFSTTPVRGNPDIHRVDHGYKKLPFDFPVQISLQRLVDLEKEPSDSKRRLYLDGWSMDVECFTIPANVTITIMRNPYRLVVKVDGQLVHTQEQRPEDVKLTHQLTGEPEDDDDEADDDSWMEEI